MLSRCFAVLVCLLCFSAFPVFAQVIASIPLNQKLSKITWSPDNAYIALSTAPVFNSQQILVLNATVLLYDASTWKLITNITLNGITEPSVLFSPNPDNLYLIAADNTGIHYYAKNGVEDTNRTRLRNFETRSKTPYCVGRNMGLGASYLVVASYGVIDPDTGKDIFVFDSANRYDGCAVSADVMSVLMVGSTVDSVKYSLSEPNKVLCTVRMTATNVAVSSPAKGSLLIIQGSTTSVFDYASCTSVRNLTQTFDAMLFVDSKSFAGFKTSDPQLTAYDTNVWTVITQLASLEQFNTKGSVTLNTCKYNENFAVSTNGKYLAGQGWDCGIKIMDVAVLLKRTAPSVSGGSDDGGDGSGLMIGLILGGVGILLLMGGVAVWMVKTGRAKWSNRNAAEDPFSVVHNPGKF
eukprot:PhF_6_TR34131/c1_g1_i3/m.49832